MNEFIVYPKKGRMVLLAILSFLFVAMGIAFVVIYFAVGDAPILLPIIGAVCVLFFGFGMIYYIKEVIDHQAVLIISDEGITDRSSYLGAGLVKWEDIRAVDFIEFGGQLFLGIFTHDPNLIINQSSRLQKMLNQVNKKMLDSQVNIPVKNLNCSQEELVAQLNDYWERHAASN